MSYVQAARIGCNEPDNPWDFFSQDPNILFKYPQTIATNGKPTGIILPAAISPQAQAFYANQVRLQGWTKTAYDIYQTLSTQAYPNSFLVRPYTPDLYMNENNQPTNWNLGFQYLCNAFTFSFLKFRESDMTLEPFNVNDPSSYLVPKFVTLRSRAVGIFNDELLNVPNKKNIRWGGLVWLAVNNCRATRGLKGVCYKSMVTVCQHMDKLHPGWDKKNRVLGDWWNEFKSRYRV